MHIFSVASISSSIFDVHTNPVCNNLSELYFKGGSDDEFAFGSIISNDLPVIFL